jgi:aspartyl-tRNA(Asn)/glutamyl-tRNA(Gln) amidotransferase subunit A
MTASSLLDLAIGEVATGYRHRRLSPVEVTQAALDRIDATEDVIHAWVLVDRDRALRAAEQAERELVSGLDRGPLHGVPIGVKDIFDVAGWPTRCGSMARHDAGPATSNADAVEAIERGGAVILGKTVTQEFAAGVFSPPTRNPWDPTRIPGGSSGGSAAAVAVGACFAALGSDTGGSIRIPAAACGVTGFKPRFGQLSVGGVFPLSWSLDTVGPLARTVADTWSLWTTLNPPAGYQAQSSIGDGANSGLRDKRIGVAQQFFFDAIQPGVRTAVTHAVRRLEACEATIVEVEWSQAAAARACAFIINRVETAQVHLRTAKTNREQFLQFGPDLRMRVATGAMIPASVYLTALGLRRAMRDSVAELFAGHQLDVLVAPALPTAALSTDRPVIEGTGLEESVGAAWTRLTMPFNATGQPVLTIPCDLDTDGLPVGLQLAGKPGEEEALFRIGHAAERAFRFSDTKPALPVRTERPFLGV